jgi:hydroxymethylbilane synthase
VFNHEPTAACLRAERAFLARLEGGCSIPTFALADWANEQTIRITGGLISLDGNQMLRETLVGSPAESASVGHALAESILAQGGDEVLLRIREAL